ncbi:MAG TPA: hypothetical protein VKB57_20985 [Acidimicrobiales bacterium]|nr:hypothetical protein [Acidimicrobiales bacterium]
MPRHGAADAGASAVWLGTALLVAVTACSGGSDPPAPVTDADARQGLAAVAAIAAERTQHAMARLCDLSLDHCYGLSSGLDTAPRAARSAPPPGSPPRVLGSRDAGAGAWMLVVDGDDGLGRHYVCSTSWQAAYGVEGGAVVNARKILDRARRACGTGQSSSSRWA